MLSVGRIQPLAHHKSPSIDFNTYPKSEPSTDINSNMIGSGIVADLKSTKNPQRTKGHSLDNDTILVILNTVLNIQQKTSTPALCKRTTANKDTAKNTPNNTTATVPTAKS